jgi:uncharacterized lipoprotein YehR (DUF1307 family)
MENGQGAQFFANIFMEEPDMADFNGAKPVMTVRDNEFKITLVDGASGSEATNKLSVLASGDSLSSKYGVLVFGKDGSGNAVELPIGAAGIQVEATDLDIRDLAFATDKVDVSGSEVSLDAATLAALENVTVSATDLDIRDLAFATDKVDVSGSEVSLDAATLAALENVVVSATDLDIRDLAFATDKVDVSGSEVSLDAATLAALENVTVSATDLDIRDLSHAQDSVKVGDGTDFLAVNTDGSINVVVQDSSGADVCDYKTTATVGVGSAINHDYVVADTKKFTGGSVIVGARGAVKVEIGVWDGTTFAPKFVYFQDPKENRQVSIQKFSLLGDGTKAVRVKIWNLDGASSDVFSTVTGDEA